ncbi:MAG: hypothetical protein GX940_07775 [Clostridiaceae bacterium]|nr:hypothetical protein [Clostridiaceae bacterium]
MFPGKRNTMIIMLLLIAVIIVVLVFVNIVIPGLFTPKGSIVILEDPDGKGFTMDFTEWNSKNKCELSLNRGDVLQIEVKHKGGEISLAVSGKNGSEPYTGNDLRSGMFTVTVSESDDYIFRITGKSATGKVTVKNVGGIAG